jgi:hypothetical protein
VGQLKEGNVFNQGKKAEKGSNSSENVQEMLNTRDAVHKAECLTDAVKMLVLRFKI